MIIRDVKLEDAKEISEIYRYYVNNTAITFEYEAPDEEEFKERIKEITTKYPFIVCEMDNRVVGYAYAHTFKDRKAYEHSIELSIYLDKDYRGMNLGSSLFYAIEKILFDMNIYNINSCIALNEVDDEYCDKGSYLFHKHLGFSLVGTFHKSGYKFDRWYDMIWMEKIINNPDEVKDVIFLNNSKK